MNEKHISNRNILITQEDDIFVAKDIETNVASQGYDLASSIANLKEALELYYEDNDFAAVPVQNSFFTICKIPQFPLYYTHATNNRAMWKKLQKNKKSS